MKYLVTGASGFVGRHRCEHLATTGQQVVPIRNSRGEGYCLDITDRNCLDYVIAREKPDIIEHFASQAIVSVSRSDPYQTYKTNILGALNVLEAAKKFNLPCMIFTSDKAFGNRSVSSEDTPPELCFGAYETSKILQDMLARSYLTTGQKVYVVRSCNIFGPYDKNSRIVPNTLRSLYAGKPPIIFRNNKNVRQFIYIKDVMSALDLIEKQDSYLWNIGSDIKLSQEDTVLKIIEVWNSYFNTMFEPQYIDGPDIKEISEQYLSFAKLHALDWHPKYNFEDGIRDIINSERVSVTSALYNNSTIFYPTQYKFTSPMYNPIY